jgi:ATP-dependent RNA helicase DDX52/ROK1
LITFSYDLQIATIYQACSNPRIKRALFSATLSNGIEEWTRVHLDNVVRITIGVRFVTKYKTKIEIR